MTRQDSSSEHTQTAGSRAQVSRIRTWNADTYTRIVIDVGSQVKYQAARISGPDRIYFDIEGAKIDTALLRKQIEVANGGFLKTVRVAQNQSGVVRVVLEVNHVTDYSVFLLPNPYRLIVDVYGTSAAEEAARLATPPPGPSTDLPPIPPSVKSEKPVMETVAKVLPKPVEKSTTKSKDIPSGNPVTAQQAQDDATPDGSPSTLPSNNNPRKKVRLPRRRSPRRIV